MVNIERPVKRRLNMKMRRFTVLAFFPEHQMKAFRSARTTEMVESYTKVKSAGLQNIRFGNLGVFVRNEEDRDYLAANVDAAALQSLFIAPEGLSVDLFRAWWFQNDRPPNALAAFQPAWVPLYDRVLRHTCSGYGIGIRSGC